MPAIVLWDFDRAFVVNTTLRDATVIVLPYQVALRLQVAVEVGGVACSPQCRPCCSHLHFPPRHGRVRSLSPSDFHTRITHRFQRFTSDDSVKSEAQRWVLERDITQGVVVIYCRRFGTTYVSNLQILHP